MNEKVYEEIKKHIEYASRSFNLDLINEAVGETKMAYRLEAITTDQMLELHKMAIRDCINNGEWRRKSGR